MKTSAACPKCGSTEIYRIPNPMRREADPRIQTGWTYWSSIPVTRYLCGQCGFIEEWIASQTDLAALVRSLPSPALPEELYIPHFEEVDPTKCPACGAEITPDEVVCPTCGINFGLARTNANG